MQKQLSRTAQITKENLKTAFWQLYKQQGHGHVTVKDVAAQAGYHRGVFYDYYANTDEVLQEIEADLLQELQQMLNRVAFDQELLPQLLPQVSLVYETCGEYLYTLLSPKGDPQFIDRLKQMSRHSIYQKLRLHQADELRFYIATEFILSAVLAAFCRWYPHRQEMPAEELVQLMHSLQRSDALEVIRNL